MLMSFWDWMANEESAFTRSRKAAALGLGPKLPAAEVNSRNTAPAWQQERLLHGKKRRRKKKVGAKRQPTVHHDIDTWLQSVDLLKKDLDTLRSAIGKGEESQKQKPEERKKKNHELPKNNKDDTIGAEETDVRQQVLDRRRTDDSEKKPDDGDGKRRSTASRPESKFD